MLLSLIRITRRGFFFLFWRIKLLSLKKSACGVSWPLGKMLRLMWTIFIWLCLKIGDPLRHLHTQFRGHISRGKGSTEGPVCCDVFLPMDADSMLKLQTLNSQYVMTYQIIDIPLLKRVKYQQDVDSIVSMCLSKSHLFIQVDDLSRQLGDHCPGNQCSQTINTSNP